MVSYTALTVLSPTTTLLKSDQLERSVDDWTRVLLPVVDGQLIWTAGAVDEAISVGEL